MAKQALLKRWTFVKNKNKNKWVLELIPIISLSLLSFTFPKGLGYNYNSFQIKYEGFDIIIIMLAFHRCQFFFTLLKTPMILLRICFYM